jgi:hypothetical protein
VLRGGGLKVSPPSIKFMLKATLPSPKMPFLKKILTFFQNIFGTTQDFHKSEVNFSKKLTPPP